MRVSLIRAVGAAAVAMLGLAFGRSASADVMLEPVVWLSTPTKADVDAAYPKDAVGHGPGRAMLACQL